MIRVLVVDDSEICRSVLAEQLEREGDIEVVGEAESGELAIQQIATLTPDLVTLDVQMPGMGGLAAIEAIMALQPRPILVVTGLDTRERDLAVEATRRGALGISAKIPYDDLVGAAELRAHVRRLASIRVEPRDPGERSARQRIAWPCPPPSGELPIVALGCSAGGPKALAELLDTLPPDLSACLAIANHLPPDFVSAYARLLETQHPFAVRIATNPVEPERGTIVLAPGGCDLAYEQGRLVGRRSRPGASWCPRVDVLFESLAGSPGAHVGVVLSGLGSDGAQGLAAMRARDKMTIVQDQASAAVWGMPRAALASAIEVLPTSQIAEVLLKWLTSRAPRRPR